MDLYHNSAADEEAIDSALQNRFSSGVSTHEQSIILRSFALAARDVILITEAEPVDGTGPRIIFVNPAFTEMTGYTAEEVLGKSPRILQGPETDRHVLDTVRHHLTAWEPFRVELTNYRKDGTPFYVEINARPIANADGWYTHWIAIQRDITERKQVERQLATQVQILDQVGDAVIAMDSTWRIVYVNPAAERQYRSSKGAALGKRVRELFTWKWLNYPDEATAMADLKRTGYLWKEQIHILPNGESFPVEAKLSRCHDESGDLIGYIASIRNTSEQKRMQREVAQQLQVLSYVNDAVVAVDNDNRITYWNRAAERQYRQSAEAVLGKSIGDVYRSEWVHPSEADGFRELALTGELQGEFIQHLPDGTTIPVEGHIAQHRDGSGAVVGLVAVLRDISDRKQLEKSKAFESQFVRDVLHSMTGRKLRLCETAAELPDQLVGDATTLAVNDVRDLSRVRATIRELLTKLGFAIERRDDTIAGIHEAVMNAILHANGGLVTVVTDEKSGLLQVRVADVGRGIARATLHRATLEYGFTTAKSVGYGFPLLLSLLDRVWLLTGLTGTTLVIEQERELLSNHDSSAFIGGFGQSPLCTE